MRNEESAKAFNVELSEQLSRRLWKWHAFNPSIILELEGEKCDSFRKAGINFSVQPRQANGLKTTAGAGETAQ